MEPIEVPALVIGAGPAGLMAADELSRAGWPVMVAEAMPSPGRKFLMAGKSGLNLTKDEAPEAFRAVYDPIPALHAALTEFGPDEVMRWARGLGQEVYTGSSGRVFPEVMKASPLLRAWLARLAQQGVTLRTRWRWAGWNGDLALFETSDGPQRIRSDRTVLACGGNSWRRLGADGAWAGFVAPNDLAPFQPANMGFAVNWSDHMSRHFGQPVKGARLSAGDVTSRGEFVVSARGLEGGGVYAISRAVREGAALHLDLFPDRSVADLAARLARPRGKSTLTRHLQRVLRLEGVRAALAQEWARPFPAELPDLAPRLKALAVPLKGPRPIDEAISTAGGLRFDALGPDLQLLARPGVFAAGEMLDWEAPTGGYLLTACLATGRWAGRAAARINPEKLAHLPGY